MPFIAQDSTAQKLWHQQQQREDLWATEREAVRPFADMSQQARHSTDFSEEQYFEQQTGQHNEGNAESQPRGDTQYH